MTMEEIEDSEIDLLLNSALCWIAKEAIGGDEVSFNCACFHGIIFW